MCVFVHVEGRRYGGIARGQHDDTTDEQLANRGSVTHLKATGLRDSLFRFWFSVQSQKNIGHIWGLVGVGDFGAETQRWEVRGKRGYRIQLHISGLITLFERKAKYKSKHLYFLIFIITYVTDSMHIRVINQIQNKRKKKHTHTYIHK